MVNNRVSCRSQEKVKRDGAKVLFATHYFELTALSETLKGVLNFSVDVKEWNGDVVFLHKIIEGSADKSYGIHVAKIAGLPHQVIERAYTILNRLEANSTAKSRDDRHQMDFFCQSESQDPQILVELGSIDINTLSPIDAFNLLRGWKEKYR